MKIKFYLLIVLMLGLCTLSMAQGYEWILAVHVVYKNTKCPSTIDIGYCSFNGKTVQLGLEDKGGISGNAVNFVLKGNGWSLIADKTIKIGIKGTCSDVFPSKDLSIFSTVCNSTTFTTEGTNPGGSTVTTIRFYPILKAVPTNACDKITLNASSCSSTGSYKWELSEDNLSWKTIGKTTSTITLTPAEIVGLGFSNPYSNKSVRVIDTGISDRTLAPLSFKLYAPPPTVSITSSSEVVCKGESNGTVTFQISNIVSEVNQFYINCYHEDGSLVVEPVVTTGTYKVAGLKAGSWKFEITNNYDKTNYGVCNTIVNHTVTEPTQVTIGFDTPLYNGYAVKCNGGSTGETTAIGSGGVGDYKDFSWSTGATTEKITGLKAGTYTVSLKDANNCVATNQVILQEPATVKVSLSVATDYNGYPVSCWDKSDGGIKTTVSGGIAEYTYLWSTGATGSSVSGLGVSSYNVTVTDGNSCKASGSLALTAPVEIDFNIDQLAPLNCPGDKTAILEAKPVNATVIGAPHYNWSTGETSSTLIDKGAGIYSLTLSDDQGCSSTKSITLTEPPAYKVSIVPQSDYNGSYIKCNGDANGILAAVVKDGNNKITSAKNYSWTENGTTIGESASVSNLGEGMYKVVITYGSQCKTEANYFLSDPDPVNVALSIGSNYNGQAISCYNMNDGKLHAIASGGTKSLTYSWNTGAAGSLLSGIGAGSYTATVQDVNGCSATATMSLENPLPVQALITDVSDYSGYGVSCYGLSDGSITSDATGGTGVYTYTWSNGKNTSLISGLAAGSYTVTVSDNNGCKHSVGQNITEPSLLNLSLADQKNISCYDGANGSIQLSASGGVGNYSYSKDNKLSWQGADSFTGLKANSYTVVLRDNNGCEKNIATTLTQPSKINISFKDMQPAFCSNPTGMATAVVSGGVSDYTYQWQDSKNNIVDTDVTLSDVKGGIYNLIVSDHNMCTMNASVGVTSTDGAKATYSATAAKCFDSSDGSAEIIITEGDGPFVVEWPDGQRVLQGMNLKKGLYNVLITDSHNCTVVQEVDIPAPDALQLAVKSETIPTCNGVCDGQLTLDARGGVGGYIYQWNNQSAASQTQLCATVYPVVLKDANGCILKQDVELKHPDPIQVIVVSSTLSTCKNGCDGVLEVTAHGGNGGYNYTWENGGNSSVKSNMCPGTYSVSVMDVKGCKGESTVVLSNTPELPLNLGGGVTLCVGQQYTLDAGAGWKNIAWGSSTGLSGGDQKVMVKDAGRYWVEVLSDKGCIAQDTFLLETSYDLLKASFLMQSEAAVGDTVVMVDISWPLPENIEWNYPLEMSKLIDNGDVVYGQYKNTGVYEVTLGAHLGECYDKLSKTITILDREENPEGGRLGYDEYVKQFTVYPNPNNGFFDVGVELVEETPITISVWHSPTGLLIKQIQKTGDKLYNIYFDLRPLSTGTYVLRLDFEKGRRYIRFVVY